LFPENKKIGAAGITQPTVSLIDMSAITSPIQNLTADNFDSVVNGSDKPVLVDFWATWCGPCQVLGHVLEEFANEDPDTATIAKVNIDEVPELAQRFGIRSIPTVLVFKNGEVVSQKSGAATKGDLAKQIAQAS